MPAVIVLALLSVISMPPERTPGKPGVHLRPLSTWLAESTHSYDVRHYRLDFDLPMTNPSYVCHEQVSFISRLPALDTFSLDFDRLVCDSVKRSGVPLSFSTPAGLLRVTLDAPLPAGDSTVVDIFFHRESTVSNLGYFFGRPPQCRFAHAMTCGCPRDNHCWFACWDHPMDKADRGIMTNIALPDTFAACSNGRLDSVTVLPGARRKYWWRHSYPISTYLMTFSASRFATWDTTVTTPGGHTVPLQYFVWPGDSAPSRSGFARVPRMMQYYADTTRFGPYPFEKFGLVPGYYGFPWGGMEHQTLVMIDPGAVNGGDDDLIAHELSHMWWGDMVTHVGYADVWLNEGFGTWAECLCVGHLSGRAYFNSYIRNKANSYFSQARYNDWPMYDPPWAQIYNYAISYCKGSWVMRMLQFVTGDTAWEQPGLFFRALRAYGDSFRYGTVSTADYQRINEQVTGLNLGWFFQDWVYSFGYPKYSLTWYEETARDSFRVITSLSQNNASGAPDCFRMPLPVRFNCPSLDTTVLIRPRTNPQVDTFALAESPDSLSVDPDNWVLDTCRVIQVGVAEAGQEFGPAPILVRPNPATGPVTLSLSRALPGERLCIYDGTGRTIRQLPLLPTQQWDRRDQNGRIVPSGIYFARHGSSRLARFTLAD